jgi:two-component system, OmpR family, response regulator
MTSSGNAPTRLLMVEDDDAIRDLLASAMRFAEFDVVTVATGADALQAVSRAEFDLIVLDVGLPDIDGFEVCRLLRKRRIETPVIFLTARREIDDLRAGFEGGGDDYLTKPFSLEELRFRIEAVLRRTRSDDPSAPRATLRCLDLSLDEEARRVWRGGVEVALTPTEFRLLTYLLSNVGRVVSKDQILERVWGYENEADGRIVETYISALRQKVDTTGPKLLHTSRGFGYTIRPPDRP